MASPSRIDLEIGPKNTQKGRIILIRRSLRSLDLNSSSQALGPKSTEVDSVVSAS